VRLSRDPAGLRCWSFTPLNAKAATIAVKIAQVGNALRRAQAPEGGAFLPPAFACA
jgi:hypothetical protein